MYEQFGIPGLMAFKKTVDYCKSKDLVIIGDVKRGDIGSTSAAYATAHLGKIKVGSKEYTPFGEDFATVNPYLGSDGVNPFVDVCKEEKKGLFILVKTSNPSSGEFQDRLIDGRPLYEWVINNVTLPAKPRQIEFARLGINNTVMSKRKLRALVEGGYVSGWDDPRMPTICGLRRRGYTPASIRNFSVRNGVSKVNSTVEYSFLEHCLREDLNLTAKRVMGVLNPVKLILTNYPEDRTETFEVENNPNRPEDGTRTVTFGRELYIEAEDFMETPVKGYFRLFPGNEVRLKTTYVVKCTGCKKDENGNVVEVYAEYDPESRGGNPADGRKIKSTIHWVDAKNAEDAEIRLYDNLFTVEDPDAGDFLELLNPDSLKVLTGCKVEAGLKTAKPGESFQFMRQGYFCVDNKDSAEDHLVFNRSVSLKDGFKKKK